MSAKLALNDHMALYTASLSRAVVLTPPCAVCLAASVSFSAKHALRHYGNQKQDNVL